MRSTPAAVRLAVLARAGNRCERCGLSGQRTSLDMSHRVARGMGGAKDGQSNPAVYNALCRPCHRWVEENPFLARRDGWKVSRGVDPTTVPVVRWSGEVYLTGDGGAASGTCSGA